ncbi:MAG: hypothetical protein AAGA60_33155, partial [Cyanobacteria bacterium P01_E01_bin.42]
MPSGFNRATQPPRFFLLFPNIWGFKGGIQVYSRILWQTLRALYPEVACDVFLKYDRQTDIATTPERTRFHCFGHLSRWQQSLGLAISVLTRGIRQRPILAYGRNTCKIGHPVKLCNKSMDIYSPALYISNGEINNKTLQRNADYG